MLQFEVDNYVRKFIINEKEVYTNVIHSRYTWYNIEYRDYMRNIIAVLEPRLEEAGTVLVKELDEFDEVIFFVQG